MEKWYRDHLFLPTGEKRLGRSIDRAVDFSSGLGPSPASISKARLFNARAAGLVIFALVGQSNPGGRQSQHAHIVLFLTQHRRKHFGIGISTLLTLSPWVLYCLRAISSVLARAFSDDSCRKTLSQALHIPGFRTPRCPNIAGQHNQSPCLCCTHAADLAVRSQYTGACTDCKFIANKTSNCRTAASTLRARCPT